MMITTCDLNILKEQEEFNHVNTCILENGREPAKTDVGCEMWDVRCGM